MYLLTGKNSNAVKQWLEKLKTWQGIAKYLDHKWTKSWHISINENFMNRIKVKIG